MNKSKFEKYVLLHKSKDISLKNIKANDCFEEIKTERKQSSSDILIDQEYCQNTTILNKSNIHKICRICLSIEEVFPVCNSKYNSTFLILEQACSLKPSYGDNAHICRNCELELKGVYTLLSKFKESTEKINEIIHETKICDSEKKNDELYDLKDEQYDVDDEYDNDTEMLNEDNKNIQMVNEVEEIIIIENYVEDSQGSLSNASSNQTKPYEGLICQICDRTFNYFTSWQCHMSKHEELHEFKCNLVNDNEEKDKYHLATEHGSNTILHSDDVIPKKLTSLIIERHYKCSTCDMTFERSTDLNVHLSTHSEGKWQCDLCGKIFVDSINLNNHLEKIHDAENESKLPKKRKSKDIRDSLETHYMCNICDRKFSVKSNLNRHMRITHEQSRRFSCHICNKSFTVKNSLKFHLYIHSDSKPFTCKLCPVSFRQPNALLRHERTKHVNEKKFHCDICLKKFKTSRGLEHHKAKHFKDPTS